MLKSEFYLAAINSGAAGYRQWLVRAFALTLTPLEKIEGVSYLINYVIENERIIDCVFTINGEPVDISDYKFDIKNPAPPFKFLDPIDLKKGDLLNLDRDIKDSTYGNVLVNWILLVNCFGKKIPYIGGNFRTGQIEKKIESIMVADDDVTDIDTQITVSEYLQFTKMGPYLDAIANLAVTSATPKAYGKHPDHDATRDRLLKKYEGQLTDPLVINIIENELHELNKEWLKGDDFEKFLVKDKFSKISMKKKYSTLGLLDSFSDVGADKHFVESSLSEGYQKKYLVPMNNASREGSYDRGFQTAFGGYSVKKIIMSVQTVAIGTDDCGTKNTHKLLIESHLTDVVKGCNIVVGNSIVTLTDENISKFVGKVVNLRVPSMCENTAPKYCNVCIGANYVNNAEAIKGDAVTFGSVLLGIYMQAAHGYVLKTKTFKLTNHLR